MQTRGNSGKYSMHKRENALEDWLVNTIKLKDFSIHPLAGDASFRRYFRLHTAHSTMIVMDAPPEKEALDSFISIAEILAQAQIAVPKIIAANYEEGFLLLEDFGDKLLLHVLDNDHVHPYYTEAINSLFKMQSTIQANQLPAFNQEFMRKEMNLCPEWFFKQYLGLHLTEKEQQLIHNTIHLLATEVAKQPSIFIHRDYHSRNLMIINQDTHALGIIDFQDAMYGPLTYDLVSLLKDCYIAWPREKVLEWVSYFHAHSPYAQSYSLAEFIRAFDFCGLQRHLKVLGVFCRLHLRDNKSGYLADLPLTLNYVLECAEIYEELHPLFHFLQTRVYLP